MIPAQVIEEIKYRNGIEEVIEGYVPLKRAGTNLVGLCPFHSEKTPSFTVFTGTKSFYCFGCGAAGDVISFIRRIENLDYVEAARFLARRAGITLPEEGNVHYDSGPRRDRILAMNRDAARFFHEALKKSRAGQAYLEKRGLGQALVRHFGIGFAENSFDSLASHLSSLGYTKEEMKVGFLCSVSKKNGRSYDIFRNRLMFPVIDVKGDIVAFGGRTVSEGKDEPKYINTSDTPVFNKRRNLFALNFAKNVCAEQMILCEGYMDVVSLHGAGFTSAVASCGTALTADQVRLMKKYTKSVVISYDADAAGQKAVDKAFGLFREVGLEARVLKVEGAKDPDEFIRKNGKEAFSRLLTGSRTRFDFLFSSVLARYDTTTADGRIKAAADMAAELCGISSEVEKDVCIRQVSERLEIPYESLKNDVKREAARRGGKEKREWEASVMRNAEGYGDRVNPDRLKSVGAAGAEDAILGILALYPERIPEVAEGELKLSPDDFVTAFNRRVYEKMLELGSGFDVGLLDDGFSTEEISRIVRNMTVRQSLTDNGMKVLSQCVEKLRKNREKKTATLEELIANKRAAKKTQESG